jgi:thioredoxin-like negative regulator of GroEL
MGGQIPGMGNTASPAIKPPKMGEVTQISSQAHLASIVKDHPGVVVDFWSSRCGPCMRFKPVFEGAARANQNSNIVFCAVETDRVQDCAQANNVSSIP